AAAWSIGADKIGVAEIADGIGAVRLTARPEIAAGEATEHGGAAGLHAFALERVIDFLDRIHERNLVPNRAGGKWLGPAPLVERARPGPGLRHSQRPFA